MNVIQEGPWNMYVLHRPLPPAAVVFVMRHLWPPYMIYLKWQDKYYSCFYGILHQLLLMSPLMPPPPSMLLQCAQKQRHAGKPNTVQRAVHGMSLCTCVMLGSTDSVLDLSDSVPYPPHTHTSTTGQQQPTKPNCMNPIDEESQLEQHEKVQWAWTKLNNERVKKQAGNDSISLSYFYSYIFHAHLSVALGNPTWGVFGLWKT